MSNQSYSYWGTSPFDASQVGVSTGNWTATSNNFAAHEQYNPVYPSYNGTTSNFFPSSAQKSFPKYFPTKKTSQNQNWRGNNAGGSQIRIVASTLAPAKTELPSPAVKTITRAKPGVVAPNYQNKVARINRNFNNKTQRVQSGRNVNRMPNYKGLQSAGNDWTNRYTSEGTRGGGGRGGRGGFRRGPPRPQNNKDDIPFISLGDNDPSISLTVSADNIVAFHGFDSVFTTQHNFPVLIEGKIYTSCDHYYQIKKVSDLTGVSCDKLNRTVRDEDGKLIGEIKDPIEKKSCSSLARDALKAGGIEKEKIDTWRNTKGLDAIQTALYAKASQSAHLREALKETGDQILVHAYAGDSIYGTGCTVPKIKKWLEELQKTGVKTLRIPATFPLTETSVQSCPTFAQGRNILGVILMQLREKIRNDQIEIVDMSKIFNALRVNESNDKPADSQTSYLATAAKPGTF